MPQRKRNVSEDSDVQLMRPALTPEAREDQMIALATNEAERRIRNGTASDTLLCTYIKYGSMRERLEKEKLMADKQLAEAKVESLQQGAMSMDLYNKAIQAFSVYSGESNGGEDVGF